MNDQRLNEIKERAAKATEGPWYSTRTHVAIKEGVSGGYPPTAESVCELDDGEYIENLNAANDAKFIAHARQDVPDLLAEALAQKESKEKAYSQLQQSLIDKAYIMQTLDNILRICETDPDNSDLRKIEEIINETIEELEAKRMNEQYIINQIMFNAVLYDKNNEQWYLTQAKMYIKRLQRVKGFATFEQAFQYFEDQFKTEAVVAS